MPNRHKLAFKIADELRSLHWENCKVQYSRAHAINYCRWAIDQWFWQERIVQAYKKSLLECHGFATDKGEIYCASSTVSRAKKWLLDHTKFTAEQRKNHFWNQAFDTLEKTVKWYQSQQKEIPENLKNEYERRKNYRRN